MERVRLGLDMLNLVAKCEARRANHFDTKFIINYPNPTLYISIFQTVTLPEYSKSRILAILLKKTFSLALLLMWRRLFYLELKGKDIQR